MSVRSRIIGIKMLKKDETLGYEQSFKAHKDMKAADVSIGYGDVTQELRISLMYCAKEINVQLLDAYVWISFLLMMK